MLLAELPRGKAEELVFGPKIGEHSAGEPAHVTAFVRRCAVLGVLLRHFAEIRAAIERLAYV